MLFYSSCFFPQEDLMDVVELDFDPSQSDDEYIRKIFADPTATTIFLAIQMVCPRVHPGNVHYECLRLANLVSGMKAKGPLDPDLVTKTVRYVFGKRYEATQLAKNLPQRLIPYLNEERELNFRLRGQ